MIIPIKTDLKLFFRQYLRLLNPILKLNNRESDVLAQLMYYTYVYRKYEDNVKWKMVFDYETKVKIQEELNISGFVLNNNLTNLRKKGHVVNNKLPKHFIVEPKGGAYSLTFKFELNEGQE